MRKLVTIALVAASLFTAACTEMEDETDLDTAAALDDVAGLAMDDGDDSISARQLGNGAEASGPTFDSTTPRPAHVRAPGAENLGDRVGPAAPGRQLGGGYLECRTRTTLDSGEPIVEMTSDQLGRTARARWDLLRATKLNRAHLDRR